MCDVRWVIEWFNAELSILCAMKFFLEILYCFVHLYQIQLEIRWKNDLRKFAPRSPFMLFFVFCTCTSSTYTTVTDYRFLELLRCKSSTPEVFNEWFSSRMFSVRSWSESTSFEFLNFLIVWRWKQRELHYYQQYTSNVYIITMVYGSINDTLYIIQNVCIQIER